MTEQEALTIVRNYFINHNLQPSRIEPDKQSSNSRFPDFIVKDNGSDCFLCEVKTPLLKVHPATNMFHWTTSISKLRGFVHTSVKQFASYNSSHSLPWILVFTSDHFQLNMHNFGQCIKGVIAYNGNVIKDLRNMRFIKDTEKDLSRVDMYLWLQISPKDKTIYQLKMFLYDHSPHLLEVERISKLLSPYKDENISY